MTDFFLKLLNMSIAASWLVLAVIILRLLLKKAPKWISCLLWGIVALRLIMPVSFESVFSLVPSAEVIPQNITATQTPAIYSGIPAVNSAVNPLFTEYLPSGESALETILAGVSALWLAGVVIMLLCGIITYCKLRRQVQASLRYQQNIYICDDVVSPFLFGIFRPRIYIPSGMDEEQLQYVLAHENAHIQRRDHWWKPLGFLLLSVYWFNPLMWLAYILLCRDVERACDEKVIAGMDKAGKDGYSEALVACSVHRRMILACPVAFGEVGVKTRIKGVLNYKKPAFWLIFVSVAMCVITAVCFLTNPKPCQHDYQAAITKDATCAQRGVETRTCMLCKHSYTVSIDLLAHTYEEGAVITEPTCTRVGSRELLCTDCGATTTKPIEKTAHIAGIPTFTREANCTETGEISATCTACHAVFVSEILETNDVHDFVETELVAATCAASGEGVITCTRCSYSESCTYAQLEHQLSTRVTMEPTCKNYGIMETVCTVCDACFTTWLPVTGHNWEAWNSRYQICTVCGWRTAINSGDNWMYGGF